ncbi:unnamed protein product [Symbiodinium microadriaticum]|nr:unnamed protein product [Symbiodinium microadriaticum]
MWRRMARSWGQRCWQRVWPCGGRARKVTAEPVHKAPQQVLPKVLIRYKLLGRSYKDEQRLHRMSLDLCCPARCHLVNKLLSCEVERAGQLQEVLARLSPEVPNLHNLTKHDDGKTGHPLRGGNQLKNYCKGFGVDFWIDHIVVHRLCAGTGVSSGIEEDKEKVYGSAGHLRTPIVTFPQYVYVNDFPKFNGTELGNTLAWMYRSIASRSVSQGFHAKKPACCRRHIAATKPL